MRPITPRLAIDLPFVSALEWYLHARSIDRYHRYPKAGRAGAERDTGECQGGKDWRNGDAQSLRTPSLRVPANDIAVRETGTEHDLPVPQVDTSSAVAHRPSRRRRAVQALGGMVLVATLAPPLLAYARFSSVQATYRQLKAGSLAVQVKDRTGASIGLMTKPGSAGARAVLPSRSVPNDFFLLLETLEGTSDTLHGNWYGLNYWSFAKTAVCLASLGAVGGTPDGCGGASTLVMQSARGAHGWWGGQQEGWVRRKLTEILDAPSLSVIYPDGSDARRAFVADNLSYGSVGGFELWGVRNASLVYFGVEPADATLAQQALLAALPLRRMTLRCRAATPEERLSDDKKWTRLRDRAVFGLAHAFAADDARALAAIAELKNMKRPTRTAQLPNQLVAGLRADVACAASANPLARMGLLASSELETLRPELMRVAQQHPGPIDEIRLTVDVAAQRAFKLETLRVLRGVQREQRASLSTSLTTGDGRADVLLVSMRPDGGIERLFASATRQLLDRPRRIGSIGKIAVALAAAESGARISDPLCALRDPGGLREANGSAGFRTCAGPARMSLSTVFGRSKNLPVLALARRAGRENVERAAQAAGFRISAGQDPGRALISGMSETSPRRLLATMQALTNGISGRPAEAPMPYILAAVRINGVWVTPQRDSVTLPDRKSVV